jgi:uncharacterized membrane protein
LSAHPGDTSREVTLQFSSRFAARVVFVACLAIEIGLVLLDYHVNFGRLTDSGALRRLTNIAREDGLASWFGTTQTLFVGLTAWVLWIGVRASGGARWRRVGWALVAMLFTYMAIDDGAQLHERLGSAYAAAAGRGVFPSFAWQVLLVPVLGAAVMASGGFLWLELQARGARLLIVGAILLFAVAVGLDFFEGLSAQHPWNPYTPIIARYDISEFTQARFRQSPYTTLLHFSRAIEEFIEMLANTCFWAALVGHLGTMPTVRLRAAS